MQNAAAPSVICIIEKSSFQLRKRHGFWGWIDTMPHVVLWYKKAQITDDFLDPLTLWFWTLFLICSDICGIKYCYRNINNKWQNHKSHNCHVFLYNMIFNTIAFFALYPAKREFLRVLGNDNFFVYFLKNYCRSSIIL